MKAQAVRSLYIFIVLQLSCMLVNSAHAERRANSSANTPMTASGDSTGLMTPDMAQSLWGMGTIPSVSHLKDISWGKSNPVCRSNYVSLVAKQENLYPTQIPRPLKVLRDAVAPFGISQKLVDKTLAVFLQNQTLIPNQRFISIFDLSKPSTAKRFVVIDTWKGTAKAYRSAHGMGSDPRHTGMAESFGNNPNGTTHKSSLGCALAVKTYHAKVTRQEPGGRIALTMLGFSASNDNTCQRGIYMHAAPYVDYQKGVRDSSEAFSRSPGRSWGCPAFTYKDRDEVFNQIDGGGLVCTWNG